MATYTSSYLLRSAAAATEVFWPHVYDLTEKYTLQRHWITRRSNNILLTVVFFFNEKNKQQCNRAANIDRV